MTRAVLLSVALILTAGPALADNKERARELHERGLRYYKVGQHAEAIRYYRQAYQAYPVPGILFNLAQAYRQNGDCALAVQTYKQFLAEVPTGANADVARGHIETLECEAEPEPEPEPAPQPEVGAEPDPAAITGTAPPPDRGGPMRLAGLISLGVAAAAGTGSIIYGLKARSTSSEVAAFFAEGGTWSEELADLEARGERQERVSIIFAITAGSAAVAGSILYLAGRGVFSSSKTEPRVGAAPVRGGLVLTTGARF